MTDKDIQEYYKTNEGESVKKIIESDKQDAVVYSVTSDRYHIYIKCWSPVWKTIEIKDDLGSYINEFQRGDIISIGKLAGGGYYINENKTVSKIIQDGKNKILKDFNENQQHNILIISEYKRARSHD